MNDEQKILIRNSNSGKRQDYTDYSVNYSNLMYQKGKKIKEVQDTLVTSPNLKNRKKNQAEK